MAAVWERLGSLAMGHFSYVAIYLTIGYADCYIGCVNMLELQSLYRSFRTIPAIEDVSFSLAAGEIVGFLGPNGAGKSTTVKIITGLLRPNEGRVFFEGRDIREDMVSYRAAF